MKGRIWVISFLVFSLYGIQVDATPFPVKGEIYNAEAQQIATAHVYPRYVEIFSLAGAQLGRAGILVEQGVARIFVVKQDQRRHIAGYAKKGVIYDQGDQKRGTYFWTPTYSYVYHPSGKRAGSVKCIAWPRVCSVAVAGYLLQLFEP